ncbi:Membrane protein [Sphingorhabdus sp. 109]|nr:Membrane protein [Sphingorhabdus sp. 109]
MLEIRVHYSYNTVMFNLISILIGIIALTLSFIGLVPLLGWTNWLILPIAGVGALFGLISSRASGMYFCIIVMCICAFRLWIGGGII